MGSGLSQNITEALGSSSAGDTGSVLTSTSFGGSLKPPEPAPQPVSQPAPSQSNEDEEL